MDGIPAGFFDNVGVVGMCVLFVVGLIRGWIVLGREHRDTVAAAKTKDEQIREQAEQIRLLSEVGHTIEQLFRGLQAERDRDDR